MTPEESIEILEEVKELDDTMYAYSPAYMEALEVAISTLKEVQQYHKIGTVEECREAVEKQNPVKPIDYDEDLGYFKCPSCGLTIMVDVFSDHAFCLNCGRKLDWDENLEGMEDV